ncbi:MAG: ribonucleoside triphosphate reductase [bacterium]
MSETITKIMKRSGEIVDFDQQKIVQAVYKAGEAVGTPNLELAKNLAEQVIAKINLKFHVRSIPAVEELQDIVEEVLIENKEIKTAKAYILYRDQHARLRSMKSLINSNELMEGYLRKTDWRIKENANMSYSLQGLNNHVTSVISANYWLNEIYDADIRNAHQEGDFHIHDLQMLATYCAGWDLKDLLIRGFRGAPGKVESGPAKHFRSALGQIINFFYTTQGECAGAQAFANFDTYLAPFIRYDKLEYNEVRQAMQEFLFNINVPTRTGFQCLSADTEILTQAGWRKHNQVKVGDIIATFNIEHGHLEYLPVQRMFAKQYKGIMYNLQNRISDQLISPEHRVVRKRFGNEGYVLEPIEKVLELHSPFIVPVGSHGYVAGDQSLPDNVIKLLAWVIAEGTMDRSNGSSRLSIYQSAVASPDNYQEIKDICADLKLHYTERLQQGLGQECNVLRFDAVSTKKILSYFGSAKTAQIKQIPSAILTLDTEGARLFLETYIKGDGHEGCKITTTHATIRDGLFQVAANAGYGATVYTRLPDNKISKKDRYIIRLIKHVDTYINTVKKVKYQGIIWCPNTKNETVIARRHGKIFITGNTPFTNITMDLVASGTVAEEQAIIGGKPVEEKYKDFQKEMDMINIAFAELMMEGDSAGRVFSFPIPTYNITKDFSWDSEAATKIFAMTAKYGIPYFSNFINSDMSPDDARSMCCRLRLDNRELRKRGGGLFGANPLTGSVGVVSINLPRLGYLSKTKEEFFERLMEMMQKARKSLEIKREILEELTENDLYPYSKYYLQGIKQRFGGFWNNHFSTIGIIGMNEALLNFEPIKQSITTPEGRTFAMAVMDFMREKMMDFQNETNHLYNLEATPGEGLTRRLSNIDKKKYPDMVVANEEQVQNNGSAPFYTNSSQLPVDFTDDIFEALDLQDDLQTRYTGGTVLHFFLGEAMPSAEAVKNLVRKVADNYKLPYFTLTPTFSVCPKHGYLSGAHAFCPKCDMEIGYDPQMERQQQEMKMALD